MPRESYSSVEDFTLPGHWWSPNGQHRPAGDLNYAGRSIRLSLLGAFDDAVGDNPFSYVLPEMEPGVVFGETAKGSRITLLDSFYTNIYPGGDLLAKGPRPVATSELLCNTMLLGTHLDSAERECFARCSVSFPNLDRWLDDRPFEVQSAERLKQVSIEYTRPEKREFEIAARQSKFRFVPSVSPPAHTWDNVSIRHRTFVEFEPATPKSIVWFRQIVSEIERFFTLVTGRVVQSIQTRLTEIDGDNEVFVYLPSERIDQPEMNPTDFLFRFPDIEEWFPQMVSSWFGESETVLQAIHLIFSSLERPGPFLETKFLPFVQASEVFSRTAGTRKIVEKSVYTPIRKALVKSIPEEAPKELRESIERGLAYANEPSLRERFHALLGELEPETVQLFCVNPEDFVAGVVDTRNHLTHYSRRPQTILAGLQLHWATIKLQTMMKVLLLKRIGIPETALRILLEKNYKLERDREAWRSVSERGHENHGAEE